MKMLMNRTDEFVFVSKIGLSFRFAPGVAVEVPSKLVAAVIAVGGKVVDEGDAAVRVVLEDIKQKAIDENDRGPAIEDAVRKMALRNQPGDFTAGGKPNKNTLAKETKLSVGDEELDPIWNKVKNELAKA